MVISNGLNQKGISKLALVVIIFLLIGAIAYLLFGQKSEPVVIQSKPTPTVSPKASPSSAPTPTPTPDVTLSWKKYTNTDGGYEFKYPIAWNVVFHPNTEKGVLFGPGAALSDSNGSVEPVGILEPGQSLKDFVEKFNQDMESGATSEKETVINGQNAIVSILPKAGEGNMEIKIVSFENNKEVFNISLLYHADFAKHPADKAMLDTFNKLLSTFKFIK